MHKHYMIIINWKLQKMLHYTSALPSLTIHLMQATAHLLCNSTCVAPCLQPLQLSHAVTLPANNHKF